MSDLHWMAVVIGTCGAVALFLLLAVGLQEARREIAYLHRELGDKSSNRMAELDRRARYALERKVGAIEHHLNITIEEEPAKLVVKKGGQHD